MFLTSNWQYFSNQFVLSPKFDFASAIDISLHVKARWPCLLLLTICINLGDPVLENKSVVASGQLRWIESAHIVSLINDSPFVLKRARNLDFGVEPE